MFDHGCACVCACAVCIHVFTGPRAAVFFSLLCELSGLVLLAFADSKNFDVFIPGILGIAVGGLMIMIAAFPISFRYEFCCPWCLFFFFFFASCVQLRTTRMTFFLLFVVVSDSFL